MAAIFYNTIGLTPPLLTKAQEDAISLQELVKTIYTKNRGRKFSPSQIHKVIELKYKKKNPITSVRRAITNLTNFEFGMILEKTETMVVGPYGYPEHTWRTITSKKRKKLL